MPKNKKIKKTPDIRFILCINVAILASPLFHHTANGQKYVDSLNRVIQKSDGNEKINALNEMSNHYWYEQELDKARDLANNALTMAEDGRNNVQKLKALNNLANIDNTEGNYDEAARNAEEALELAKKLGEEDAEALSSNLLGNASYFTGNYENALTYWQASLNIREKQGNEDEAATLMMNIGVIYRNKGEYKKAIEFNENARVIHEKLGNIEMVARILGNIGNIYFYSGLDYGKALEYYTESLEYFKSVNNWQGEANIYNSIGLIYDKQDSIQLALSFFNKSYTIYQKEEYQMGMGQTLNSIGSIYLKQEKLDEALENFYKCLEIFEELGMKRDIALTQNDIGGVFFQKKDFRRSLRYKLTALKMLLEMDAKKEASDIYKELSEIYLNLNDYENAFKYQTQYSNLKDSLISTDYSKQISEMRTKYESEKKDKAILEQENELKKKNIIIYAFVLGIMMFVGFSVLLIKQIRQKKKAHDKITKQNKEITDSIQYASRIQNAVLPSPDQLSALVQDYFILFKPKDIVSGDFYWMTVENNILVVAAADCTGHGVPGAFMSMLGISFLNELVKVKKILTANRILNELRKMVKSTLAQSGENVANDGMDISLVIIDQENQKLQYAGAYNHLYYFRKGELNKVKADRMPIGNFVKEKESFTNHEMEIYKEDTIYIMSDGYCDQFGGERDEKYSVNVLMNNLQELHNEPMHVQQKALFKNFAQWKGTKKQIDDVLVIGIRL